MKQLNPKIYSKFHEHREQEGLADAVFCLVMALTNEELVAEQVSEDITYGFCNRDSSYIVDAIYQVAEGYNLAMSETN